MGCRQTKPDSSEQGSPVHLDLLNEGNGVPHVDPRLPLNARQVFKLKQSWKGIKRNIEETGVEMFIRLFKNNSYLIKIFKDFKQLETEDEMRENEELEKHATFVMSTLDETITNIDNFDYIKDLAHRTGNSHQRFSDFQKENFKKIKQPFLEAVKITLGDRYTDYMATVYTITIDFVLDSLVEGYTDDTSLQIKLDNGQEIEVKENDRSLVKAAES
ncbi:cytoglobin-1-like [Mytilus californianus]|uniref:cytoglobin-1-like n=1 Tax=Mytilus californianus TaxID=6549 RepID=UPI0022481CE2|nr:cytoglobin-1-like [Mytilus californianus]